MPALLANYLQAQPNGAYSIEATVEFQCEEAQWRTVERTYFAQPMAEGEPKLQINRVIEQFYLVEFLNYTVNLPFVNPPKFSR